MGRTEDRHKDGVREYLDPTPTSIPAGFRRPPSLIEQMRSMIRNEFSEAAAQAGRESFEEANDFDLPDEPDDPTTPWEIAADGDDDVAAGLDAARHAREARKAGWKPGATDAAWEAWAKANGWTPPKPVGQAAEQPQAPSAGAVNSGNPASGSEASRHSPST